jgi:hypothetical protein
VAVYTLTRPMQLNRTGNVIYQFGVGQYWLDDCDLPLWWVLAHTPEGKREPDNTVISNPGPPPFIVGVPAARAALQ